MREFEVIATEVFIYVEKYFYQFLAKPSNLGCSKRFIVRGIKQQIPPCLLIFQV
jgi:hypothetical protein